MIRFVSFLDHKYIREAIKKGGKIQAKVSKVLVQGPARVGKTSVKSLILSQRYHKQESTGIAERPQVAVGDFSMQTYGQNEDKKWELISDTNIVEMFANDIKSVMEKGDERSRTPSNEHKNNKKGDSGVHDNCMEVQQQDVEQDVSETHLDVADAPLSHISISDNNTLTPHIENASYDDISLCPEISPESNPSPQLTETRHDDLAKQLSNLLNKVSSRPDKLTLYKDWLYFIDSGGQIQFQQILQAFIPCVSVLMLVINLAQDLSSQSSAELQCEDGKKYLVSEYSLQVETLLRRLISMITFRNYEQRNDMTSEGSRRLSSAIKPPDRLKVITIATHGDKCELGQVNEAIAHKVDQLKQIFQSVSDNLLYQNPTSGELLFKVDGRKASDPEETFDDELKSTISNIRNELSKQAFEVDVPLTWYAYEILLRDSASSSCGVLTLEECMSLGIALGLEDDEIEPALRFFSLLNSILYYPKEITNLAFIDPHSLIEIVNELMILVCKVRNGMNIGPGTLAGPDMANFGIISSDIFSHEEHFKKFHDISKAVTDLKSEEAIDFKSHLFSIFTHLLLAVKLPNSKPPNDKYFMPALLPLTDPSNAIPFESSTNTALLFYFRNGAPVGLFCAMIVNLLSTKVNNKFLWSLDKSTSKIYSNSILLHSKCWLGEVGLVESSDWFGICCKCPGDQPKVKKAVENAIAKTKKKRKKEVEWEMAFFCPCGQWPRHLAFLEHHYSLLFCELIKSPYGLCIQITKDLPHFSWISLKSNQGMVYFILCYVYVLFHFNYR